MRYQRFTLRDLLWLTVVVAMGLGWWADHRWMKSRVEALIFEVLGLTTQMGRENDPPISVEEIEAAFGGSSGDD